MTYQEIQHLLNQYECEIRSILPRLPLASVSEDQPYIELLLVQARMVRMHLHAMQLGYRTSLPELYRLFKRQKETVQCLLPDSRNEEQRIVASICALASLSADNLDLLLTQFPPYEVRCFPVEAACSGPACRILTKMFRYAVTKDDNTDAAALGLSLTRVSACSFDETPELHRSRILDIMDILIGREPQTVLQIAQEQEECFSNNVDSPTCHFLWYYGLSLYNQGRTDEAAPIFRKCGRFALHSRGETSWFIAACQIMNDVPQLLANPFEDSDDIMLRLENIVERYRSDYYTDTNDLSDIHVMIALRALLISWADHHTLQEHQPYLDWFAGYCAENEDIICNPLLTVRHAMVFYSMYYFESGNFLQAVAYSRKALEAGNPCSHPHLFSDEIILTNLLTAYNALGDTDAVIQVHNTLVDKYSEYSDEEFAENQNGWRVVASMELVQLQKMVYSDEVPDIEDIRDTLANLYEDLDVFQEMSDVSLSESASICLYLITRIEELLLLEPTRNDLARCRHIAYAIYQNPSLYPTAPQTQIQLLLILSKIEFRLNSPLTSYFLDNAITACQKLRPAAHFHIMILAEAARIYYQIEKHDAARLSAVQACSIMENEWHKFTSMLSDQRVSQALSLINSAVQICYSVLRKVLPPHEFYEYLLRFKDLPALVCRERNRFLQRMPVDTSLTNKIFRLMDQIAAVRTSDQLSGRNTVDSLANRLTMLEAEFAEKFPENLQFTPISLARTAQALPRCAALIEYHFAFEPNQITGLPPVLEVFLTIRQSERPAFRYISIPLQQDDWNNIYAYVELLQDDDAAKRHSIEMARLRTALYELLLVPVESFLDGIDTLYLAPELALFNIPFEILGTRSKGMLQDHFRICRLTCGRDMLFITGNKYLFPGAFVLGNPDYDAHVRERTYGRIRSSEGFSPVNSLPFSGLEATRISRRCHTQPIVGSNATKLALHQALPRGIVHLATHGQFIEQHHDNALFGSSLVFAGYNRWLKENTDTDNGILTADEISRMDLRKTQLVVLSACCSGMQHADYASSRGLVSAFSATGARWVISHLWKVDDLATVILMDKFYEFYLTRELEVPDALKQAKSYLQNVTIGQLRQDGWFEPELLHSLPEESRSILMEYGGAPERMKPFSHMHTWGGFVCYKCN